MKTTCACLSDYEIRAMTANVDSAESNRAAAQNRD
jgi:hypothetical protein